MIQAQVTSRLDYCSVLYMGLPLHLIQKLQLVQNATARLLMGTDYHQHKILLLKSLHCLPLC